jgi:WD40 repeat protein
MAVGGVRIFNAAGETVQEFRPPEQEITCLAFSPNGAELLCGTERGALLVWDVANGTCSTLATNVGVKVDRVAWLGSDRLAWGGYVTYWQDGGRPVDHHKPAGAVLDTPGEPRGAFLLEGETGKVVHTCYDKEHGSGPLSVAFSPDGNTLAVGYAPYDIILWNARTGERDSLLPGHSNWVVSLAFSADSKRLISGAGDGTASIWDIDAVKQVWWKRVRSSLYLRAWVCHQATMWHLRPWTDCSGWLRGW